MIFEGPHGVQHRWDMRCPIEAKNNLAAMEDLLADRSRATVSQHEASAGLEQGEPDLTVARRVIKQLFDAGSSEQAHALECIVCHGNWTAAMANPKHPGKVLGNRCGKHEDTLLHAYYVCEDNDTFKDASVAGTQRLAERAVEEAGANAALWL